MGQLQGYEGMTTLSCEFKSVACVIYLYRISRSLSLYIYICIKEGSNVGGLSVWETILETIFCQGTFGTCIAPRRATRASRSTRNMALCRTCSALETRQVVKFMCSSCSLCLFVLPVKPLGLQTLGKSNCKLQNYVRNMR